MSLRDDALEYHANPQPGKVSIKPTKACETARDLALAYSPGVAEPCLEIEKNPQDAYKYTSKGNLVAVISNGTAVLGLGNIGAQASKPVMEGKGVLFKTFADIDVFDLEIDCNDPEKLVDIIASLAPTFGGINLEDIKAPECFFIEEALQRRLTIPVFHDDQHGTAIIAGAALINALEIVKKEIGSVRVVINGAGAAAVACAKLLFTLGVNRHNLMMLDTKGVIYLGREEGMNPFKQEFAVKTDARSLDDAMNDADVFFGLSAKDVVSPAMLLSMSRDPIVFAMANPDPEIDYPTAKATRSDVIFATGRSDYPNQVNNVLGFPYIFRGALDVRAKGINEEMKMAAVKALALLAKEPVPDSVRRAYGNTEFSFGREYLIPKPFDPRALYYIAPAVAKAALESGIAAEPLDLEEYTFRLKAKQNHGRDILRTHYGVARASSKKRIVLPEATNEKVLKAASLAVEEGIAQPILIGDVARIRAAADRANIDLAGIELIDPDFDERTAFYQKRYYEMQCRRGVTTSDVSRAVRQEHIFANLMLAEGGADGVICGIDRDYPSVVKPILDIVGLRKGVRTAAGLYIVSIQERLLFFADTTINIEMTAEKLADIAVMSADFAGSMNITPRVAMLSFSNFGSSKHPLASMVREATALAHKMRPDLIVDGEMQADTATMSEIIHETYPFSTLHERANVLVFPDMQSGNISYKLLQRLGEARVVGPVILGLNKPAYALQRHAGVDEILNMITLVVGAANSESILQAHQTEKKNAKKLRVEPQPLVANSPQQLKPAR